MSSFAASRRVRFALAVIASLTWLYAALLTHRLASNFGVEVELGNRWWLALGVRSALGVATLALGLCVLWAVMLIRRTSGPPEFVVWLGAMVGVAAHFLQITPSRDFVHETPDLRVVALEAASGRACEISYTELRQLPDGPFEGSFDPLPNGGVLNADGGVVMLWCPEPLALPALERAVIVVDSFGLNGLEEFQLNDESGTILLAQVDPTQGETRIGSWTLTTIAGATRRTDQNCYDEVENLAVVVREGEIVVATVFSQARLGHGTLSVGRCERYRGVRCAHSFPSCRVLYRRLK